MSDTCLSCRRPLGQTVYVIEGLIGTYHECEWCYAGTDRPPEPVLIVDTFKPPHEYPFTSGSPSEGGLFAIVDKLTGTSREQCERVLEREFELWCAVRVAA